MPRFKRIAIALMLSSAGAHAAPAEEDIYFADLPLVASVSRLPQRISETPAAVTVIDQEMIRASGFRTVEDLLRLVPGFQVTSHNQDPAIVAYHGLNSGLNSDEYGPRVQVLIDGRSQYSPLFKSGVNWNLLPVVLDNIERIEVTRGPNTVSYGSNAFMGVINIITIDPALTQGWLVSANYGNNGIRDDTLRWGGKVGDADVRFTLNQLNDNGFQRGFYSNVWTYAPDDRRSRMLDLRANLMLTPEDELQLTASQSEDVSQYGRPGSPTNDPLRYLSQQSRALGLQWRRIVSADEEYKFRYAYVEDHASAPYTARFSFDTNVASPASVAFSLPFDPGGQSRVHELEFEHRLAPFSNTRLIWGGGAKFIALNAPAQFSTSAWQERSNYRGFANLEYRPERQWLLNLGASLEHDSISGTYLDPRASLSYHLLPDHTLRIGVSRAHRSPSLYETQGRVENRDINGTGLLNITYLGQNPAPERIDTFEWGYLGEFKPIGLSVDVRAFHERIPNYITIVPVALPSSSPDDQEPAAQRLRALVDPDLIYATYPYGRADSSINLTRVDITGYEYQLRWQPFESTRLFYNNTVLSINADLTNLNVIADAANNIPKIATQTRESAPTRAQSAMLIQKLSYDLMASVLYFRNGAMRWRRNGDPIQPSERIDWRLAKSFKFGEFRGEVAYTMQMANESQEGRQPARLADRLQWLSLRLNY